MNFQVTQAQLSAPIELLPAISPEAGTSVAWTVALFIIVALGLARSYVLGQWPK